MIGQVLGDGIAHQGGTGALRSGAEFGQRSNLLGRNVNKGAHGAYVYRM
jgi:hypothetical protein